MFAALLLLPTSLCFFNFFDQEQQEQAQEHQEAKPHVASCLGYVCPATSTCVSAPILCACLTGEKCFTASRSWYHCVEGKCSDYGLVR